MPVDFMINIQGVNGNVVPSDQEPMKYIKIDDSILDWEGIIDASTRLDDYNIDRLSAIVTDQLPNLQSIPNVRFITGDSQVRLSAKHCNFDGDDCWYVRSYATIESISANTGYTTGGQTLRIRGWGFNVGEVSVTIAGEPCTVQSVNMKEIVCVTSSIASAPAFAYRAE